MLDNISHLITRLNKWVGEQVSWLCLLLVFLICFDVLFRYVFSSTQTWIIELEWHIFALIFLLGAGATFARDEHVRVDVFYNNFSDRNKNLLNFICTLILLLPWCIVVIYTSFNYSLNSLYMLEGSPNPGGLPARYLIKFMITIGFLLLFMQGVAALIKSFKGIFSNS